MSAFNDFIDLTIVDENGKVHENAMRVNKEHIDFIICDYGQQFAETKLSDDGTRLIIYEKRKEEGG